MLLSSTSMLSRIERLNSCFKFCIDCSEKHPSILTQDTGFLLPFLSTDVCTILSKYDENLPIIESRHVKVSVTQ